MSIQDREKIRAKLEALGVAGVKQRLEVGAFAKSKIPIVQEWLRDTSDRASGATQAHTLTTTDKIISFIKNNRIAAVVIVVALGVIGFEKFAGSLSKLRSYLPSQATSQTERIASEDKDTRNRAMSSLSEQVEQLRKKDHATLLAKYPEGYFLFASNRYAVVPTNPFMHRFSLSWEESRARRLGSAYIYISLRKFHYRPTDIVVENLDVVLDNRIGAIADGLYFDGIGLYVELVESNVESLIYVIGFRRAPDVSPRKQLEPHVVPYLEKLGVLQVRGINTNNKNHILIERWFITSAWSN
ncbi:MAG TPA: hypothetical protein VGB27_05720 [Candidatus Binatia bacterium]